MSGLYVPLDVEYASDDKIMRAGPLAELLYVRALAFCKRTMSDGVITSEQLAIVARGIGKPNWQAARLVQEGLWNATGTGWEVVAWHRRNKSKQAIETDKEVRRNAAQKANHDRWHQEKPSATCPLCRPISDTKSESESSDSRSVLGIHKPKPEPKPEGEGSQREREKESSSSHSDLQHPVDNRDEDDDIVQAAMLNVTDRLIERHHPTDPFAYRAEIRRDTRRLDDIRRLRTEHPTFDGEQLAALHFGRDLAHVTHMHDPEPEPATYEPPPPAQPVEICAGCDKVAPMMRAMGCKLDPKPDACVCIASVHPIRGAS